MRFPSWGDIARNGAADAAKIGMDKHFWGPLVGFLAKHNVVPRTTLGRIATIGGMSTVGALIQANVGEKTLASKLGNEIGSDAASEVGRRMLDLPTGHPSAPHNTDTGNHPGIQELTAWLNRLAGH